jgi:hypothetical protein
MNALPVFAIAGNLVSADKQAAYQNAVSSAVVTACLVPYAWNDSTLFTVARGLIGDTSYILDMHPMPLPSGMDTFTIDNWQCGKYWTPEYEFAWETWLDEICEVIADDAQCMGICLCFVAPYGGDRGTRESDAGDDEDGEFASDPAGGNTRYDSIYAAQGYTPSAAVAMHARAFNYAATKPELEGKIIRFAMLTPGNQPRVNDASQVTPHGNDAYVPTGIVAALKAAFPQSPVALVYDVYTGAEMPAWWRAAIKTAGDYALQAHGTDTGTVMTEEVYLAAYKSACGLIPPPLWFEAHQDQIMNGWAAQAVAAVEAS